MLARLIQGFSAGGEVGASTTLLVEHATPANRGYMASWQFASQGLGILLGAVVVGALSYALTPAGHGKLGLARALLPRHADRAGGHVHPPSPR